MAIQSNGQSKLDTRVDFGLGDERWELRDGNWEMGGERWE